MGRSLLRDYRDSLSYPEFWMYAMWLDLLTKYRRSRLGLIWAVMPPVLYAFGIGGFYALIGHQPPSHIIAHLGMGYVVYRFVTATLNECTVTFTSHAGFIQDGRIRFTDYVLRVIAKALFYLLLSVPVMAVALYISPQFQWMGLFTLIPALLVVLVNVAWMGALVAVLGARLPDVHELMGSILMFAFLFTPILWHANQAPSGTIQGFIARLNPLFHLVEIVRAPLLGDPISQTTYIYLALLACLGWAVTIWVYKRYARFVPIWI